MLGNLVIFGDSYSTYEGYIPQGYKTYYSPEGRPNVAVTKMPVDNTWWKRTLNAVGGTLLLNNSWSGSTVCNTSLDGNDCSQTNSFIFRYNKLVESGFFKQNKVDTLLVFGGTNDSWGKSPLGEAKYSDWNSQDLYYALPAMSYFAYRLSKDLPNTNIIFLINTGLKPELVDTIERATKLFGLKSLRLSGIEKDQGHPTVAGMKTISEQLIDLLISN